MTNTACLQSDRRTPDFALLDAWSAGDSRSGNRLFKKHFPSIYRFFRTKIEHGVEDLVQQTFLAAVESRDRFRRESSFRTYLFATAKNILYAQYRRKRREQLVDYGTMSIVDLAASPSSVVGKKAEDRLLLEALRNIPVDFQVVLELYMWEEMTGPELAQVLGLGVPGVRSRLRRAKVALRAAIDRLDESPERLMTTSTDLQEWAAGIRKRGLPCPPES